MKDRCFGFKVSKKQTQSVKQPLSHPSHIPLWLAMPGRGKMVQVDENQYTGVGKIYAVGDVAGGNLATIGQAQAVRAVRKMFGSGQYTLKDSGEVPQASPFLPRVETVTEPVVLQ